MLVFFRERLVFLSVPKTGTTAWAAALGPHADIVITDPPELKHAPLYRYDRFFRQMFLKVCDAEMETLAVMREPVSWLGSWYRYRRRPFLSGQPNSTEGIGFDAFVQGYLQGRQPPWAQVGSQARFLQTRPGGAPLTHLFRYEEPDRLRAFLGDRLGDRLTRLPEPGRHNVSPEAELALSADTEARLRRKCAEEFALYDGIG